jgi:hypothetical protein
MSLAFYANPKKYRIPLNEEETKWETVVNTEPHKDFLQALQSELKYQKAVILNEINSDFDHRMYIFDEALLKNSGCIEIPQKVEEKSILIVENTDSISNIAIELEYLCIITESSLSNWRKERGIGIIGESYGFYGKKDLFDENLYNKQLSEIYEYKKYCYFSGNETNNLVKLLVPYILSAKIS